MNYSVLIFKLSILYYGIIATISSQQLCPPPDIPVAGTYIPKLNKFLPGDRVAYTCKEGFSLLGKEVRTCKSNGAWSDRAPFCDSPAKLKNPHVTSSFSPTISRVIDGNTNTCFDWTKSTGHSLQVYLNEKAIVHAVRIFLNRGTTKFQILTGQDNNKKVCADYDRFLEIEQWALLKCRTTDMLADSITISNTADKSSNITICEIEVYVKDEYGCEHPPELRIANGYFEVSRNKATLFCEDGYKSENSRLVCEGNSWKGQGPKCEELLCDPTINNATLAPGSEWIFLDPVRKVSAGTRRKLKCSTDYRIVGGPVTVICLKNGKWTTTNATCIGDEKPKTSTRMIIIGAVVTIVFLVIIALLGITICIVKKQRSKEVVVVFKPSADGSMTPGSETEYASAYYETIHHNAPNLPASPRPPVMPPVLHDGYILPDDAKETLKRNKPMPADIAFGTLKQSTLYGN